MSIENIRVCKGALTDNVYAGYLSKNKLGFKTKVDVTNDFLNTVIKRWNNQTEVITNGNKKWRVTVVDESFYEKLKLKEQEYIKDEKVITIMKNNNDGYRITLYKNNRFVVEVLIGKEEAIKDFKDFNLKCCYLFGIELEGDNL